MLQPTNRLTLIDAMRPPAGFRFESAMAVTFTLDLRALLAAPTAFTLAGPDFVADDNSHYHPIELLHALRTYSDKLTIFSQAGEIALPPSRRVFAFLEKAVVPVRSPRGGVVHPKVWVLRYEEVGDGEVEHRLRVLIASRNLTFDASWDTVIRLDETASSAGVPLGPVGDLFEGLLSTAVRGVSSEHRERVLSLTTAVREATFGLPANVDDLQVHVLGLKRSPSPLPAHAERCLIISPFVTDDFFNKVHPASVDELVSRVESLDGLSAETLDSIAGTYAFDDGSALDVEADNALSPEDPGRPLIGLHAKVFAYEQGERARLFLGSANATAAAFNSNVEVLVELTGSVTELGIDCLFGDTEDEPGIRSRFFNTYLRSEAPDEPVATTALDRGRRTIAFLTIEGLVEKSGMEWAVKYRSAEPLPPIEGVDVHCWPLASASDRRKIQFAEPLEVRFETTLEAISGFLAFELKDDNDIVSQFVVPVPLTGVPENRDRALLRALVGNAERFLRYLLALLNEDGSQLELLDAVERVEAGASDGSGTFDLPVLERLLRTMRRDQSKLADLDPLVVDLAAEDALPPGFAELWETIREVLTGGAVTK